MNNRPTSLLACCLVLWVVGLGLGLTAGGCSNASPGVVAAGTGGSATAPGGAAVGCPAGQQPCGSSCVNLQLNLANCGSCGVRCGAGQTCAAGTCSCGEGQTACNGMCVDTLTDSSNCGGCGAECSGGQSCTNGACVCSAGELFCSGQCTDTSSSATHCGSCGNACGAGQTCENGSCVGDVTYAGTAGVETGVGGNGGDETGPGGNTGDDECSEEELKFSFFVTSLESLRRESGDRRGYGGNLGGLSGADAICQRIAEYSTPCASRRIWRAFLSTVAGPVHAKDRIGNGPWYDRIGRTVSTDLNALIASRPGGADPEIENDLPNEFGIPNHDPDGTGDVDNHDMITGTETDGTLYANDEKYTCGDWSRTGSGTPRCGHSWPTGIEGMTTSGGTTDPDTELGDIFHWISAVNELGCDPFDPDNDLIESGRPISGNTSIGSGGGYGGFYCFALQPGDS